MADITKRIPIAIGIKPSQTVTFTNKTIDCGPGNGNVITNIPNSALQYSSINLNGTDISLGEAGILTGSGVLTNYVTSLTNGDGISLNQATGDVEVTVDATLDDIATNGATTTQDITVGKIYFKNVFGNLSDLPSATDYHGMFAHVHNEGHGYFAHAGSWIQLLDSNTVIGELSGVNITSPSNGEVLKYDGTNWVNATDESGGGSLDALSDVTLSTPSNGEVLKYDGTNWVNATDSGLASRTTASAPTASAIAPNDVANLNISNVAKTYCLLKIQTSHAAWVTVYTDIASRTADASRLETEEPAPGSGVIAEIITTGATTQILTPGIFGFNNESPVNDTVYVKLVSKESSGTATHTVTLHYLQLEV